MHSNNKVIQRISFDVLSKDDVLRMSVVEINQVKNDQPGGLYDPRMGPTVIAKTRCSTCGLFMKECSGHFGHIVLNRPIFNPLFEKEIVKLLKNFCFACGNLYYSPEDVEYRKTKSDKQQVCVHCSVVQPAWETEEKQEVFTHINMRFKGSDKLVPVYPEDALQMFNTYNPDHLKLLDCYTHPRNFVLEVLTVLPPTTRPIVVMEDGKLCDDDLTYQYGEILKSNRALHPDTASKNKKFDPLKALRTLCFKIGALFNNSSGKAKHNTNNKPVKGIKERLSSKTGIVRDNLMGKRVEQSGRTVIGPDPTLRLNQIAVPQVFSDVLSVQEHVNRYNLDLITTLLNRGKVSFIHRYKPEQQCVEDINVKFARMIIGSRLQPGDIVIRNRRELAPELVHGLKEGDFILRDGHVFQCTLDGLKQLEVRIGDTVDVHLQDGDPVLFNRQPTLHKGSMIAFETTIRPGKTLRVPLCNTSTFNADFDGDEGNVHVPQKHNARCEMLELSSIQNHLLSQRNGQANIKLVQDNLTALYLMSVENSPVARERLFDLCAHLVTREGTVFTAEECVQLLSQKGIDPFKAESSDCITLCLPNTFTYRAVIRNGRWIRGGIFNKKIMTGIIQSTVHVYDPDTAIQMINNLTFISNQWLYHRNFSIGLEDCLTTTKSLIPQTIQRCFAEAKQLEEQISHHGIRESRVQGCLNKARDVGMKMSKDGLKPGNNFLSTLHSGSKGDFFNIAQIAGCLGQQNFRGARIQNQLNHGRRSLYHYDWELKTDQDKYESRGFIRHSFLRGLNPREAFLHSLPGREGITDTALGTSSSGYSQRKIIKLMEDIHVSNDGTVRDEQGKIYQFCYGPMGLDCTASFPFQQIADSLSNNLIQ